MLYRDRLDMSIGLPNPSLPKPEIKASIPLAGCVAEVNKKDVKEVVIKDGKGKKLDTLGCETAAEAEQWVKYIGLVVARLPKAAAAAAAAAWAQEAAQGQGAESVWHRPRGAAGVGPADRPDASPCR
jgi:hypothetical protein